MLKEIFLTDELVDNLRIIHKAKMSKKETFELIKINNDHDEVVMMPLSSKTLYDMYVLIGGNLKKEFNKKINEDLSKYVKYVEFKEHDDVIGERVNNMMNYGMTKTGIINKYVQKLFPSKNALEREFDEHKLEFLLKSLLSEEENLLDVHYIGNYLRKYDNVDIDFDKILIDSINDYIRIVATKDGGHYPEIADIGTAQDYFTSIVYRSNSDVNQMGRLSYRKSMDKDLISFANDTYKSTKDIVSILCMVFWFGVMFGEWCFGEISLYTFIYFMVALLIVSIIPFATRRKRIIKKIKNAVTNEQDLLEPITSEEHSFILNWYII